MQASTWAEHQFGQVHCGDRRRTRRLVHMATAMVTQPNASLPRQMGSPAALKGAYRLMNTPSLTHACIQEPHWHHTRNQAHHHTVILMVQDTTEIDYTAHPCVSGLGPIGDGRGRGYLLQSLLAIDPTNHTVLGLANQIPVIRQGAPKGESCAQRRKRERESQMWLTGIKAVGTPDTLSRWVHVGDRYADMWAFFTTCQSTHTDFLVRVAQDRRVASEEGVLSHVFAASRSLPCLGEHLREVHTKTVRQARLQVSAGEVMVLAPRQPSGQPPLSAWLVRVVEVGDPPHGEAPLEWLLLTTVPVVTSADAWERVDWYRCRWMIEEYHQCLKTGCGLENSQFATREALERFLGVIGIQSVALLQLRDLARQSPATLATSVFPSDTVRLVAHLAQLPARTLTAEQFWKQIARIGGFQGRKRDGQP